MEQQLQLQTGDNDDVGDLYVDDDADRRQLLQRRRQRHTRPLRLLPRFLVKSNAPNNYLIA